MLNRVRWPLRLLWVLGTLGRFLVLASVDGAALVWANRDAGRPDSVIGDAVGIGLIGVAVQCVVAGLWAVGEGVWNLPLRLLLWRWSLAVFADSFVAPIYNQLGSGPMDYGLLVSDAVGGAVVLGVTVVGFAFGGWVLGRAMRPRQPLTPIG